MEVHDQEKDEQQYSCIIPGCSNAYRYYSSLKKHMRKYHAPEYKAMIKTRLGNPSIS